METGGAGGRAGLQQQQQAAGGGGGGSGGWVLVEARLQGGAPWGFTLQGGLEHGELLIISKVEEGGKADRLERPLLVGDEIIIINDIELTGYRQEAIALVKGSYKTLQLTVRREFDPGYIEEFGTSPPSLPDLPPPSPPPPSSPLPPHHQQQQQDTPTSSRRSRPCSAGGVQLRIKNRRSETASRPHSWHSTKLGECQQQPDQGRMDAVSSAWHHNYHASASTTDLSGGFESGGSYLRKSPDQYSSRGSMESLDPPQSSQHHHGVQHHHSLGHHAHSGPHPAYSSCHQLSSARSSNSIDHLHSKRDSAYSSFSTSSSIPEYLASAPSSSPERCYSLETVPQRVGGSGEMQQADIRYIRTIYDTQQGLSQEHELSSTSAALLRNNDSRSARGGQSRDVQGSGGGVCYRGSSSSSSSISGGGVPASNRHSVGPIWGPATSRSSYESLKGAPAPPRRSDSYAAIRNHERPNSWSSLEHARSLRSLQKGSWHHSSGPLASGSAKGSYSNEGQLHTVIEKSPESSPTIKPRQGGGFPQPPSPPGSSSGLADPTPQSGRLILPTGVYPVPQPEPHYAQMPSSSPVPSSSGVYPALAKESSRQHGLHSVGGWDEEATEGLRDGRMSTTENGYQNTSSSSYHHSSSSTPASAQLRNQAHETDRPHLKPAVGSEGQAGTQRPQSHQGPYNQRPHIHSNQGLHSQMSHEQNQDLHSHQIQSTSGHRRTSSQEWRDPYTLDQSRRDKNRSMDQPIIHRESGASSRVAQGQVPSTHLPVHPQAQDQMTPASQPRHHSDSAVLQHHQWEQREQDRDREHPLTRLENALAEVQRCASPESVASASSHGNSNVSEGNQGPSRCLSVLEKVSRFERRERGGKPHSHNTGHGHNKAAHHRMTEKGRNAACGAEDLRNMLERSTNGPKAHRTLSYRGGSNDYMKYRTPADPSSALQRSRSTYQLDESREGDRSKEFPWRQDIQEMLGSMQDTSLNRSYRDSVKDAQSKVLRSTSFRRKDLNSSTSPPPSAAPPPVPYSGSHQPPPVPAKYHSLEKRGPKTKPKPQGVVIPPQSPTLATSPHTPKERHVVGPENRGSSPPALPNIPPVGPPAVLRICGRKRLTADQKKRSYSEPENMNEVGVSDAETTALFRRGGETSVADRRKMFELVANRFATSHNTASKPDLRQLQHDALAEYVERKRGVKRDEGGPRSGPRPRSAYVQPENNYYAGSYCHSDTLSLSSTSTSSLNPLQDSGPDRSFSPEERRQCSTLPTGGDLRSLQSNLFYPGRVTSPRPPANPQPSAPTGSPTELQAHFSSTQHLQDFTPEAELSRQGQCLSRESDVGHQQQATGVSKQHSNGALQRVGSVRGSGKSASAEDLLERSEEKPTTPYHYRSRSSPSVERLIQDFPSGDIRMFGVFISEPGRHSVAGDRPTDLQVSGGLVSSQSLMNSPNTARTEGPSQNPASSHTPVTRRERQRNSERQRANSTSTLAASVGLPCPFSPSGTPGGSGTEWHASERLSQANLDAITFPGLPQTSKDGDSDRNSETMVTGKETRQCLSDSSILEDTTKDMHRRRALSFENKETDSENTKQVSSVTPTPMTHFQLATPPNRKNNESTMSSQSSSVSVHPRLPSLRISESSLFSSMDQQQPVETSRGLLQEYDEVFLQNPPPPSPPPPIKETNITEDFPPPPSPVELDQSAQEQTMESLHSSLKPQPFTITSVSTSSFSGSDTQESEDTLGLGYQPLPKREKTSEELRVEALAQQLVSQDSSLAPLLDTWGGKSTIELVEEIFPNSRLGGKLPWQRSSSNGINTLTNQGTETDLDEDEKDLDSRKVELCDALSLSLAALRQEKEALYEEQRRHQALGASIESLVQERCKTNERDKYSMFIGDLEKIVNLLLSLCTRLSRIDRSLLALEREELSQEDIAEERDSLHHKRSQLLRQTEDARELKENLDRRQRVVHNILSGYLIEPQLQDFRQFISTKPSLMIHQRNLDDLIRQGEEQLTQLAESLPPEVVVAHDWSSLSSSSPATCSSPFPPLLPPSLIPAPTHSVRSTTVTSL
ncbi:protein Shroom3 [Scomber japonicus]|uniref:protein Shroom3 n=1 Tax=Scomber japonicus TaxID=13676 RepID=UPI0023056B23|nr:protein Shroom3 [Scomber japonicus]